MCEICGDAQVDHKAGSTDPAEPWRPKKGLVWRDPAMFDFFFDDLFSPGHWVATVYMRLVGPTRADDKPFGACVEVPPGPESGEKLSSVFSQLRVSAQQRAEALGVAYQEAA